MSDDDIYDHWSEVEPDHEFLIHPRLATESKMCRLGQRSLQEVELPGYWDNASVRKVSRMVNVKDSAKSSSSAGMMKGRSVNL